MFAVLSFVLAVLAVPFKSKRRLEAENAALRHQVMVLRRQVRGADPSHQLRSIVSGPALPLVSVNPAGPRHH